MFASFVNYASAHGLDEGASLTEPTIWSRIFQYDFMTIVWSAVGVIVLAVFVVLYMPPQTDKGRMFSFSAIALAAFLSTAYLAGGTIYENLVSFTGGPVHWHADFRIFECGREITLIDPTGLSNRVGTPEVHEHNDGRLHIEGTLATSREATLHYFFEAVGGALEYNRISLPTNNGLVNLRNGSICGDANPGIVQVFLWESAGGVARQRKIFDFENYVISPEPLVPPGDCVVIEFAAAKSKTEFICEQYAVAQKRGDLEILWE